MEYSVYSDVPQQLSFFKFPRSMYTSPSWASTFQEALYGSLLHVRFPILCIAWIPRQALLKLTTENDYYVPMGT